MSLERLGVDSVSFYLSHAPDPETPIEQTLEGFAAGIESKQVRTSVVARDRERGQSTTASFNWPSAALAASATSLTCAPSLTWSLLNLRSLFPLYYPLKTAKKRWQSERNGAQVSPYYPPTFITSNVSNNGTRSITSLAAPFKPAPSV
jgi:hypothetical protein